MTSHNTDKPALFVKNSLSVFGTRVIDIAVSLLSVALVARYLGVESYGNYAFVIAFVGLFIPFTYLGLERIAIRELSRNAEKAEIYLGAVIITRWILSAIVAVIIIAATFLMRLDSGLALAIMIAMISELVFASGSIFTAVFKAFEKMWYETFVNSISRIFMLFLIIAVIVLDLGFIYLFIALLAANSIRAITGIYISNRKFFRPVFRVDYDLWKFFLKESYILGIAVFISLISFRVDILLLKFLQNPGEVAIFQIPFSIIIQLQIVPVAIITALFPMFSRLSVSSPDALGSVYEKSFKFIVIIALPIAALLFSFSNEIITYIFGPDFHAASAILQILVWLIFFLFLGSLFDFILVSMNMQAVITRTWVICFVLKIILDFILIPVYASAGAAIANLIVHLILCIMLFMSVSKHLLRLDIFHAMLKPSIAAVVMIILLGLKGDSLLSMIFAVFLSTASYLVTLTALKTFTRDEIDMVKGIYSKKLKRAPKDGENR